MEYLKFTGQVELKGYPGSFVVTEHFREGNAGIGLMANSRYFEKAFGQRVEAKVPAVTLSIYEVVERTCHEVYPESRFWSDPCYKDTLHRPLVRHVYAQVPQREYCLLSWVLELITAQAEGGDGPLSKEALNYFKITEEYAATVSWHKEPGEWWVWLAYPNHPDDAGLPPKARIFVRT